MPPTTAHLQPRKKRRTCEEPSTKVNSVNNIYRQIKNMNENLRKYNTTASELDTTMNNVTEILNKINGYMNSRNSQNTTAGVEKPKQSRAQKRGSIERKTESDYESSSSNEDCGDNDENIITSRCQKRGSIKRKAEIDNKCSSNENSGDTDENIVTLIAQIMGSVIRKTESDYERSSSNENGSDTDENIITSSGQKRCSVKRKTESDYESSSSNEDGSDTDENIITSRGQKRGSIKRKAEIDCESSSNEDSGDTDKNIEDENPGTRALQSNVGPSYRNTKFYTKSTLKYRHNKNGLLWNIGYGVWVNKNKLQKCLSKAKDLESLVNMLIQLVFTKKGLDGAIPVDTQTILNSDDEDIKPNLDEQAMKVVASYARAHAVVQGWL